MNTPLAALTAAVNPLLLLPPSVLDAAHRLEEAKGRGRAAGLSADQVDAIISAEFDAARIRPEPVSWDRIHEEITKVGVR